MGRRSAKILPFKTKGRYVRTIPLEWIERAIALPGKSLAVGVLIWHRKGLELSESTKLPMSHLRKCGMSRWTVHRALDALEGAHLIRVERQAGCLPRVTIVDEETD
jgi:hypothetical protein